MDYMEDSKMEVLNYLRKQKVDIAAEKTKCGYFCTGRIGD